ncbi:chromate efflux transporter [Undibacterium sp. SXout11W]|uniref:chromate efflux transporter n=1 Tax=Undibacterium sp. SXout11W TaxID=3413050 RepID=UPI003BF2A9AF
MTNQEVHKTSNSVWTIFKIFLRLGCTSFGGPIAHLGFFRAEFVEKRQWLDAKRYADLLALCQFLPGPASSQVGIALGLSRGGIPGALAAFLGFTLPSAIILTLFALTYAQVGSHWGEGWLHGFKLVSVAVVAQALWAMGKNFSSGWQRAIITLLSAAGVILLPPAIGQIFVIAFAGVIGMCFLRAAPDNSQQEENATISKRTATIALILFFTLLIGLPLLAKAAQSYPVTLFDNFYRTGALVFGGGHVVLPLLESQVVQSGWVSEATFLTGYGATQAMPGPLFTFAAFLGASSKQFPSGWLGASIALAAIFLPAFLLVIGALPFWEQLRHQQHLKNALSGINAAVVGMLLAAFYHPVWTSAIHNVSDFLIAAGALALLTLARLPAWLTVFITVVFSGIFLS